MAEKFTIADLAKTTGVTKQTVTRRARELGILDTMQVVDARGTRAMTAEQASMLADAVTKAAPEGLSALSDAAEKARQENNRAELIDALRETITDLKQDKLELREQLEAERRSNTALLDQNHSLQVELAHLHSELLRAQAGFAELTAAHWWQKRSVVARYALPAPSPAPGNE